MRASRGLVALTAVNFVLLAVLLLQQFRPVFAESQPSILRGSGLQIVDSQGRVRASISVIEPQKSGDSEQAETVLLRLITEKGRPSVKLAASEPNSGLSFAGPTGTKDTYVILHSKDRKSELKLRSEDGQEQILSP